MERNGEHDRDPGEVADIFARGERSDRSTGPPDAAEVAASFSDTTLGGADAAETDAAGTDSGRPDPSFEDGLSSEDGLSPEDVAFSETAASREAAAATDLATFAEIAAITRLKYRYLRSLDTKSWEDLADTMIPEATATYSEYLQFESREAFVAFLRNTLGPRVITEHRCDHPEIDITGGTATGTWLLADTVLIPEHNLLMRGAAYYTDRYVRCDDGKWRISHTGYERTYEVVLSLSDLPSLRVTSVRWGIIAHEDGVTSIQRDPRATSGYRESDTA